jgi:putative ABC transport system permease protein
MWRNYVAAALHNLFRNRVYAIINIVGLALGFVAALLITMYVRDEQTFDQFFTGHERVYRISMEVAEPGRNTIHLPTVSAGIAAALESDFSQVEMATRLVGSLGALRQGDVEVLPQNFFWADPDFFRMFPFRTVSGELNTALDRPDGIVLSQSTARRLFGNDQVLGRTVMFNRAQALEVTAVIEDLPWNSNMVLDAVASGLAPFSRLAQLDTATAAGPGGQATNIYTYIRLRDESSSVALGAAIPEFVTRRDPGAADARARGANISYNLIQLSDVHFLPPSVALDMKPPGDRGALRTLVLIAALILVVAACNFVSMMTARAVRRSIEVGVRKAVGASRGQIRNQFLAECLLLCALSLGAALAAAAALLPSLNGFLQRSITFDFFRDPVLFAAIAAAWLVVGLLAGLYPALVLSRFRPATVLKGGPSLPGGAGPLRQGLAALQFATLVALIIATIIIHQQTRFARENQLRVPGEQVFRSQFTCGALPGVRAAVASISGVLSASCASEWDQTGIRLVFASQGEDISIHGMPVDARYLSLMNIQPIAGRLLDEGRGEDMTLATAAGTGVSNPPAPAPQANPALVINESAARALGFAAPREAVGAYRRWQRPRTGAASVPGVATASQIVGVVPDFSLGSVRERIEPMGYYIDPLNAFTLYLRLDGTRIPETMRAVEAAVKRETQGAPFVGQFLNQILDELHGDIRRLGMLFTAFAAVAVGIAALGLLGLAIFTAERRTREIGVRKCMGASRRDILGFIAWQFARPVLLANLIAWPAAWFFMHRWLQGFAYHVDLGPLPFVLASAVALSIALITVVGHVVLVARSRPAEALRYE